MKIIKGISPLYSVLNELKSILENEFIDGTKSAIIVKVKP